MTKILELYHSVLLNVFFYSEDQIPESNKIAFLNFSQTLLCGRLVIILLLPYFTCMFNGVKDSVLVPLSYSCLIFLPFISLL